MHQVHRRPLRRAANQVTLVRAVLVACAAVLAGASYVFPVPGWSVVAVAAPAWALDAVDGWVARRTDSVSRFGARFDLETDAALILVLSAYVAGLAGWWVLLLGAARYLLLGAELTWPRLRGDVPSRRWRKSVAAVQGMVLLVAAGELLPMPLTLGLLAVAAALLAWSFGTEVLERLDISPSVAVTVSAIGLSWVVLTVPGSGAMSPGSFLRVPVEGVLIVVVVVLLPRAWGGRLAILAGALAAVLLLVKALNAGFHTVLDRTFHPMGDWVYLRYAVDVVADSTGGPMALGLAALLGCLALTLLALVPLAARRTAAAAHRHRGRTASIAAGAGVLALLSGTATTTTASLVVDQVSEVRADLRDRAVFAGEIAADDFAGVPGDRLLRGLRGKDVLLVFVESYGRSALEQSSIAPGVLRVLTDGERALRAAGYHARSAYLTSPAFGAGSWLAHASVQAGLWVDSQRRYDQLLGADRLTLTGAFGQAGWRTVFAVPANTRDWPEGADFYGFDKLYDSRNAGYRGPGFGYASMPDQYTLDHLRARELAADDRPRVMAEIDLVSSHHPWTPRPPLIPWGEVGDGSVFDMVPKQGGAVTEIASDRDLVRRAYGESIEYTLSALFSFLTTQVDDDVVVVVVGDHQPYRFVSGEDAGRDVPVSVIARDPASMERISGWGWNPGLRPRADRPSWRMDAFRDEFLAAFS